MKLNKLLSMSTFSLMLLAVTPAFAQTLTCNQLPNSTNAKLGYYERFIITFNSYWQITEIQDLNVSMRTNQIAGGDPTGSRSTHDAPLNPTRMGNAVVYSYYYQDIGDGDYPGPKTKVTFALPLTFYGQAEVIEDAGSSGKDVFILNCQG